MLYVTTRSKIEVSTPIRAMRESRAPDGGLYLPAKIPTLTAEEVSVLLPQAPREVAAVILNRFFGTKLTGAQVESALGAALFGATPMSHRIVFLELWHRDGRRWDDCLGSLAWLIAQDPGAEAGTWLRAAAKIAILFAAVSQLRGQGRIGPEEKADLFVMSGDMIGLFAGWYAGQMGLPMGNVVCCCSENSGIWDLICRGQMKLDARKIETAIPECDKNAAPGLEMLLYASLGAEEADRFVRQTGQGGTYFLGPEQHRHFRKGLDACVVSSRRLGNVVCNLYRTNGYVLCPYSALIYSGLMDYRSTKRRRSTALILSTKSPLDLSAQLAAVLGTEEEALRGHIRRG